MSPPPDRVADAIMRDGVALICFAVIVIPSPRRYIGVEAIVDHLPS
jgi:hypothetical protein